MLPCLSYDKTSAGEQKPARMPSDSMSFMFESTYMMKLTHWGDCIAAKDEVRVGSSGFSEHKSCLPTPPPYLLLKPIVFVCSVLCRSTTSAGKVWETISTPRRSNKYPDRATSPFLRGPLLCHNLSLSKTSSLLILTAYSISTSVFFNLLSVNDTTTWASFN